MNLRWWRIEVNEDGKVLSCVAVEHVEKNGKLFFYVQAHDQKEAGRIAWNRFCRDIQRVRRVKLAREGKCPWCGRATDRESGKRCSRCLDSDKVYKKRQTAKEAGKVVPPLDRSIAVAARKAEEREATVAAAKPSLRLDVLLEVQQAWQDASTNGLFTRWLNQQIAAARGRKVA